MKLGHFHRSCFVAVTTFGRRLFLASRRLGLIGLLACATSVSQASDEATDREGGSWAIEQSIELEEDARVILEELATTPSAYQQPAARLLEVIPQAAVVARGSGGSVADGTRSLIENNLDQLVAVAQADPSFTQANGFHCLHAHSICELRGHAWFDCQLAMIVCMFSHLNK